ncbi:MAG: Rrf2 family transcriptional regulator [Verrucomicrobiae bacterium]|nr:Rrf2 family transcriptional regulator [Verrucomicrobiae bacterium]
MKITQAAEYGILGALYLAKQVEGRRVMIDEICEVEKIPRSFLAKIFQSLSKAGLVKSRQGAGGGFQLTKKPAEITVLDVFEAIEGKMAFQRCLEEVPDCLRVESCSLCAVFSEAQNKVAEVFARTTLHDLMHPPPTAPQKYSARKKKNTEPMAP